jgi:beta-lactamase regulating signal transducer with metallopeptidase domain
MSLPIEQLNVWGDRAAGLAWPMLWQSSVLIGSLFVLDFLLRDKVRAAVRYAMWLLVLLKLVLPPSLALPSGLGWWLRVHAPVPIQARPNLAVITYGPLQATRVPNVTTATSAPPPRVRLSLTASGLLASMGVSLGLLLVMAVRYGTIVRDIRRATPAPGRLAALLDKVPARLRLRMTERPFSPAVCGLIRPVILLPRSLAERLAPAQLRAVLMHELIHLKRGDVWVNCAQSLLQIVYWWHPLLWLANARIRTLREEAVDDAVMLALNDEADGYAPTLLQVARLALQRPLATLGLVGILESHSGLRRRIERLVDFHPPARAGLSLASVLSVVALAAVALPMEEAPAVDDQSPESNAQSPAANLLQEGKLLYLMGKFEEAEAKLKSTVIQDPQNRSAYYYLNLIREKRFNEPLNNRDAKSRQSLVEVEQKWATPPTRDSLPVPNPYARTNLIFTSKGRQAIVSKMLRIRLDTVSFDDLPLSEVVRFLRTETINRDPEHKGINFILSPQEAPAPSTIDPTTSLPSPIAPPFVDLGSVPIRLNPPLSDLRIVDVLDAIVKVAGQRIRYSIEDYGIVFSMRSGSEPVPLYTRIFKVDPNNFRQGLEGVTGIDFGAQVQSTGGAGGGGGGAGAQNGQGILVIPRVNVTGRGPSAQRGAGQSGAGGASTTGIIQTNAMRDLQTAVRDYFSTLGVSFVPGDGKTVYLKDHEGALMVRASLADLDTIKKGINSLNTSPPQILLKAKFIKLPEDEATAFWNFRFSREKPGAGPWNAFLSPAEAKAQLARWKTFPGVELINEFGITTLSGRQSSISGTELQTVSVSTNATGGLQTNQVTVGPILDVLPVVQEDGFKIQLKLVPVLWELVGEDAAAVLLPHLRKRETMVSATLWDGQTIVIGNPMEPNGQPAEHPGEKRLLVLVTATIVDPAGNPYHTAEDMQTIINGDWTRSPARGRRAFVPGSSK